MAKRKKGRGKSNRSPQRWLYMSVYPIVLAILFFGVTLGGWAAEAIKSEPTIKQEYDDRDADDWLKKLGIDDMDDLDINEATLQDLIDSLDLDIDLKDLEKGKLDGLNLDELGLGDLDPDSITLEDITRRINEMVDQAEDDNSIQIAEADDDDSDDANLIDDETDDIVDDDSDEIDWYEDLADDSDDIDVIEEEPEDEMSQYYYYSICNDSDRKAYMEMYDILSNRKGYTRLSSTDTTQMERVYYYVMADHPEIFYVHGFSWRESGGVYSLTGSYTYSADEMIAQKAMNMAAAKEIADSVPSGLSEYETIKYFYKYLVDNTTYQLGSEWNQEISSVFINHVSVCAGYARAMQYLLQLKGIQALYITGDAGGPHAWNVVRVDGQYYQLDVCWADPNSSNVPNPDYAYLCITTDRISKNHTVDEEINPIPDCVSMDANFYVQEGYYLESFDIGSLEEIFEKSKTENRGIVYLMAADNQTYGATKTYLIDQGHATELYYGEGKKGPWRYTYNDELYTLSIYKQN